MPNLKAVGNISSGFNVPTLYEQTDTPTLMPEKYKSREIGLVSSSNTQLARLVYFQSTTTNAIDYSYVGNSNNYKNIGKVENQGFEFTGKTTLSGFLIKVSAVTQNPQNISSGTQLARRAKEYGSIDVSKPIKDINLGAKLFASSERKDSGGSGTLAGYSIWSFYASRKIDQDWTARLKLENAFDRNYELVHGYNTPGRGVFLTLQYQPK